MSQPPKAATENPAATAGLRFDIVAGLTAAAVVLPKAMAYASVAGLPVAVGLYTAFVPMAIYALLGSSRVLSVSSTTTLAILAGTQLGLVVPDGDPARLLAATATLAALVGAMLMAGGCCAWVSSPISFPRRCSPASRPASGWSSCSTRCPSCWASTSPSRLLPGRAERRATPPQTSLLTLAVALARSPC